MTKGANSQGKRAGKITAIKCRRCGRKSFHISKRRCSSCGFGSSAKLRKYNWQRK